MTIEEIDRLPMVFIIGVGRSGTTLLRSIMNASSESVFPPESKLIIHLKKKYFHKNRWTTNLVDEFLTDLYKEKKFDKGWRVEKENLRSYILSFPLEKLSFQIMIKLVYLSFESSSEKNMIIKVIGDKNPVYSIFIEELIEIFPRVKFIHMVRDYRDVILSNKKLFKRKNVANLAMMWKMFNKMIERSKSNHPEKFYMVRYIDLVENPEDQTKEIFNYCRLNFSTKILKYRGNIEVGDDHEYADIVRIVNPNLFNEINTDRVGKWKEGLLPEEVDVITYILADYGKRYGYEPYENYSGRKYRLRALSAFMVNLKTILIIKGYFLLPMSIRDMIKWLSNFLFTRLGYYNFYNFGDFIKKIKNND